jgi:hypothetical protein
MIAMRKYIVVGLSIGMLLTSCVVLFSCKEDEPFVKPKLSFALTTLTVNEADDLIEVEVILDKAFSEDIKVVYSLAGTAVEKAVAGNSSYDYEITGDYLSVKILKGETVGKIEIQLYSDLGIEDDELIDIQLESVNSDQIEITRDDRLKITVKQENGMAVVLEWGTAVASTSAYADVDMDMFFWAPSTTTGSLVITNLSSTTPSYSSPEVIFLPNAILDDATYGLSYNFYEGKLKDNPPGTPGNPEDPMNFRVTFAEFINGSFEALAARNIFNAAYKQININAWDLEGAASPVLVQTFKKTGTTYSDFSAITIPTSGSRTNSQNQLPLGLRRVEAYKSLPEIVKSLLIQ